MTIANGVQRLVLAVAKPEVDMSDYTDYYFDAVAGDDANDGKSAETAKKTLKAAEEIRRKEAEEAAASADPEIDALVEARTAAKKAKNFAEADRIRDELKARGIEIIDTPQGTKWRKV